MIMNHRIEGIYNNYINGDEAAAARLVRGSTKKGIARVLIEYAKFSAGMTILLVPATKYEFELFVMRALENQI